MSRAKLWLALLLGFLIVILEVKWVIISMLIDLVLVAILILVLKPSKKKP